MNRCSPINESRHGSTCRAWVLGSAPSLSAVLTGDMPTRRQQETMVAAWRNGWELIDLGEVKTFSDLAARAQEGDASNRS